MNDPTPHLPYLQRRVMRLLLLHEAQLFRGTFRLFYTGSELPTLPLFQHYDRYLRLMALGDELLDDLMPRIRRQLSLQTTQHPLREEAPTRGDVNWQRTIERQHQESPGLPPLRFDTRLRQRSSATPENLFVVALLLHVRAALRHTRTDSLADEPLLAEEEQTLVALDERTERELAAPYARALHEQAAAAELPQLAEQVTALLRPGPSPYRDLLAWWERFRQLQVGRGAAAQQPTLASQRQDDKLEAWLYELWIALELIHLLQGESALLPDSTSVATDRLRVGFVWQGRRFRFRYNRQWRATNSPDGHGWEHGPGTRPDYTIERETPLHVTHEGTLIWHEPPVVWDAKYYLSGHDPHHTHGPLKKMLGDLLLVGAKQGALFFPTLAEPPADAAATRTLQRQPTRHAGGMGEGIGIRLYHLAPGMPLETIQARLRAALNEAADVLPERPPVACHGVWLDPDSVNASRDRIGPQILCPKPHIGPDLFDLVSPQADCLRNPRLCHVIGQPILLPSVIRTPTDIGEMAAHGTTVRDSTDERLRRAEAEGDEERAEQFRQHIFVGVGQTIERYVKLKGNTQTIEETFERWIFGDAWRHHARCLAPETRDMLLSGEYVWQEYQSSTLDDWAAPAIQFCRALEAEIRRRLYNPRHTLYLGRRGKVMRSHDWTLGTPVHLNRTHLTTGDVNDQNNWRVLCEWVEIGNGADLADFQAVLSLIEGDVHPVRNDTAHGAPIPKAKAQQVRQAIIGSKSHLGILAWLTENLDAVDLHHP